MYSVSSLFGQGFNNESNAFSIHIEKIATGQIENIIDTLYNETCVIEMTDASQINKILFVLKDEANNSNLYGEQIIIANPNDLTEGISFSLNGNEARVTVGPYVPTRQLKYTVILEDINGNISEPKTIP